jgi:hypothetical protein
MSFLHTVRLAFYGTFQADVSTVNNDVRHFDNEKFKASYQEFQQPDGVENGWWNPTGSGAFRLLGCRVGAVFYGDGSSAVDPAADPVVGMLVAGADDRTSGKLVDIDPQWQLASALFGFDVRLANRSQPALFGGRYLNSAFRDLWFSRWTTQRGDRAASATFQSVLERVAWGDGAAGSRVLRELRDATFGDRLSLRMATFGYQDDVNQPGFTIGTVVGAIGPYLRGEPTSFVRGRRFTPASGFTSWAGITWFTGSLDEASSTLFLDLSNALQIKDAAGTPVDIGALYVGALTNPSAQENTPATADNFERFGEIPYRNKHWLRDTGGVFALRLTAAQVAVARERPLALVVEAPFNPGAMGAGVDVIAIRESEGGLSVCAEPSVLRVDGGGSAETTIFASRYGAPLANASVQIAQTGPSPNQGGGPPTDPKPPTAPIPVIGVPVDKITLPPAVETNAEGTATLTIATRDPGNPRKYIDGQLYVIDYRLPGQSNQARSGFDYVVVHVRDAFAVPADPTWNDVKEIFVQYGNLYPIMSKRLVNLNNPADVRAHAKILRLAFSLDFDDPNYMPVTRDLSEGKRQTILKWLDKLIASGDPVLDDAEAQAAPAAPARPIVAPPPSAAAGPPEGSKTRFARGLSLSKNRGGQP